MIITLDIETIPTSDQTVIDRIAAKIKPPGSMKKAETIAKWEAEEKQSAIEEAVNKTALNGLYGKVLCYSIKFADEKPITQIDEDENKVLFGLSSILNKFKDHEITPLTVVGHNVGAFDLNFLKQRYMVNGIRLPKHLPFNAKPWDASIYDTMLQFAGHGNYVSLDDLCFAFGIESSKKDLDGSKVAEYFRAGRLQEIADYCEDDVEKTYCVYKHMNFI